MYSTTTASEFSNKFSKSREAPYNNTMSSTTMATSPTNNNTDPNHMKASDLFNSTIQSHSMTLAKKTGGGFQNNNMPYQPTNNDIPVQPVARWRDRLIDANYHPSDLSMTKSAFNSESSVHKEREGTSQLLSTLKSSAGVHQELGANNPLLTSHPTGYKTNFRSKNIVSGEHYSNHQALDSTGHESETKSTYSYSDPYGFGSFMNVTKQ